MIEMTFRLAAPLPLLNEWERMHFRAKGRHKTDLAWEILAALGRKPAQPIERAEVLVWRHSIRAPDQDGLIAKRLLDALQPASKRHPYGIGVIAGDDPARLVFRIQHVRAKHRTDQCTVVVIRELAAIEPVAMAAE